MHHHHPLILALGIACLVSAPLPALAESLEKPTVTTRTSGVLTVCDCTALYRTGTTPTG